MKKKILKWMSIGAIIGIIMSIPLFFILGLSDREFCPKEKVKVMESAPGCKNIEGVLENTGGWFCENGTIYKWGVSHCMTEIIFFPFFPFIDNVHPDAGLFVIYLLLAYGAVLGALMGFISCLFSFLIKRYRT
ncbi:MAG: hypothetical protein AABX04_01220 [Nanoarchaeota archaeon]